MLAYGMQVVGIGQEWREEPSVMYLLGLDPARRATARVQNTHVLIHIWQTSGQRLGMMKQALRRTRDVGKQSNRSIQLARSQDAPSFRTGLR